MDPKDPTTERLSTDPEHVPERGERRVLPEKVSQLRRKLFLKAKQEPEFRFYVLYDRIYRKDVLMAAWAQVRANGGARGPDGVTIDQIVAQEGGSERLVEQLHEELRTKTQPGVAGTIGTGEEPERERHATRVLAIRAKGKNQKAKGKSSGAGGRGTLACT